MTPGAGSHMSMKSKSVGHAPAILLLVLFVLIAACGADRSAATPVGRAPVTAGYDGLLFDTHAHLDDEIEVSRLAPQMQRQGVMRSVLFAPIDPDGVDDSARDLEDELARYPGMFVPFFHVNPQSPSDIRPERASRVVDQSGIPFRGYGEMALYRPPFLQTSVDGPEFRAVFAFAGEKDLVVMVHLRNEAGEVEALRRVLAEYPDTQILIHGSEPELFNELPDLLRTFPNLYFTLDTASLTTLTSPGAMPDVIMFSNLGRQAVINGLADPQSLAEQKAAEWLPVIEAAPDRVMWGTDVAFGWHLDDDVYGMLVDFSRRFVEELPAELRDAYAHGNAERLLGEGVSFD